MIENLFFVKALGFLLFLVAYIFIIFFYDKKHYIIWSAVFVALLARLIDVKTAFFSINWNVMGVFLGTMIVAQFFIESKMTDYLANCIINRAKRLRIAILAMCALSGFISIFAENVATVLILAPIAMSVARKLKTSAIPFLIGIAVSSNLQGAGTLIGDPPSMILAGYAKLTFNEFFWLNGKPSIFFAVQAGAIASLFVLYFLFRKYRQKTVKLKNEKIRSIFPTLLIIFMISALAFSSFIDPEFKCIAGLTCMFAAIIGTIWHFIRIHKKRRHKNRINKEIREFLFKSIDWPTCFFLAGIFIMVGLLSEIGILEEISHLFSLISGTNAFIAFMLIVWISVLFSAFVDNVPYLAAMIPVSAHLAESVGVSPYLMYFGLLIGASVGGNITPIGASANIVATGMLKKEGYKLRFFDFVKIGLPFTLVSTAAAVMFVWLFWA